MTMTMRLFESYLVQLLAFITGHQGWVTRRFERHHHGTGRQIYLHVLHLTSDLSWLLAHLPVSHTITGG